MESTKKTLNYKKIAFIIIIFILALIIARATGLMDFLSNIDAMQSYFQSLGFVGYGIYILLYIVVAVFMLPASLVTIVAGIVFGPILGAVLALTGSTIGATMAFIIAKYIARDFIVEKFQGNSIFDKVDKGFKENGASFLILTRLVPIFPYNIQNYAYGITSMKVLPFALISFICMAPGAFIYAFMAGEIVTNGVSFKLLVQFAIAGLILFFVSLIPKQIAKKKGITLSNL
ncbi:MAG: TVP38/TMEM64 family protein [Lachnospirales bacterium]